MSGRGKGGTSDKGMSARGNLDRGLEGQRVELKYRGKASYTEERLVTGEGIGGGGTMGGGAVCRGVEDKGQRNQ